jgi:Animal haem peroxidase
MATKLDVKHGEAARNMTRKSLDALNGHGDPGKFGRMFPMKDALVVPDEALLDLARSMKDLTGGPAGDNPDMPAGFTYLGQFVDHDITLDLTPIIVQETDPLATQNFRTPGLDLDALYGPGPALAPFMYQRDPVTGKIGARLIIGKTTVNAAGAPGGVIRSFDNDLPRSAQGRAIIGDERNDENLLVAQTHLAFLKFHNAVVSWLETNKPQIKPADLFDAARQMTTWHYQWIVLFDFIERLTGKGSIKKIKQQGRKFYRFKTTPYIPVEFAAAAYRLGHSMVREVYDHNRIFNTAAIPASLTLLFHFTGKSGGIVGDMATSAGMIARFPPPPGPQDNLPSNWIIDWRRFYDFGVALPPGIAVNHARKLDPFIVPALHTLPGEDPTKEKELNLAFRNLRRGVILGLPSGQDVAAAMNIPALTPSEINDGSPDGTAAAAHGLHLKTPLWYYILKEAQLKGEAKRLGPVGATIIAEVFLGLVHGDNRSFLALKPNWTPELPRADAATFTMVDLLNFVKASATDPAVNDLNPLG